MNRYLVRRSWELLGIAMATLAIIQPTAAQCGSSIAARHGGETTAVAYVDTNVLIVAHGLTVDLMRWSTVDSVPTVIASVDLDAPAVKVSMSFGSGRAFVLMADGRITVIRVLLTGQITTFTRGATIGSAFDFFIDILASDSQVFAVEDSVYSTCDSMGQNCVPVEESAIRLIDFAPVTPTYISRVEPLVSGFLFDRITRVGNRIWAGIHQDNSTNYGVDAIDFAVPATPARINTVLNFIPLNLGQTKVTAITSIGVNVFIAYRNGAEDWMRALDTTTPTSTVWRAPVDLNSYAERIASVGNQLHVAVGTGGISVWNTANPAALAWLGTTAIAGGQVHDVVSITNTNYTAAGYAGFHTLNSTTPSNMTNRSLATSLPASARIVRQTGNRTIVCDTGTSSLRIFDYTLSPASQAVGNVSINPSSFMDLSIQPGGSYVCLGGTGNTTIQVVDINNPAAPFVRGTITLAASRSIRAMTTFGTRLHVADSSNTLYVVDLSNPAAPIVRATLPLSTTPSIVSMASWSNALAIAWDTRGVWFFDTTIITTPVFASSWDPGSSYRALSLCKGPTTLYVGSFVTPTGNALSNTRLESLDVSNLAAAAAVWSRNDSPNDILGYLGALSYAVNGGNRFVVSSGFFSNDSTIRMFDVTDPAGAPEIDRRALWNVTQTVVPNGTGSRLLCAANDGGVIELATPTQWTPVFLNSPLSQTACIGQTATFTLPAPGVSGRPIPTLRWYRNGVALSDGPTAWGSVIAGSSTSTLTITIARRSDRASYSCRATNSCGTADTVFAVLTMCVADFNCSGTVTVQDIFDFLSAYFSGNTLADINGVGGVTVQDIFDFLTAYFAGC